VCGEASPHSIPLISVMEGMEVSKATMHRRTPRIMPRRGAVYRESRTETCLQ
jgi:hypothetical protein